MADVVNLRTVRKRQAREAAAQAAQENRIRFGRTRAEKAKADAERRRAEGDLDGAVLRTPQKPKQT